MKTWKDVPWEYDCGRVYAQDSKGTMVCIVPETIGLERATIGRAIAFAWNADLVQAKWARELFGVDDEHVKVQNSARV